MTTVIDEADVGYAKPDYLSPEEFYVVGGTLDSLAECYIQRGSDRELYQALGDGKYCYVLTARQMGKSSLMVRTAARLSAEGAGVAVLDLSGIGQNLNPEQWYAGLVVQIGQGLGMEGPVLDIWRGLSHLGPLQRWTRTIAEVASLISSDRLVIFIDEIDAVRGLPFSTDEFFAGIREAYNRRGVEPVLRKLTFCLLGVATPSDLIKDTRTTPFNIGQRIELSDFTMAESKRLACGLRPDQQLAMRLLERILHWTGGHPFLTQQLCQAVAVDDGITCPKDVDRLCAELMMSEKAQVSNDNLLFVRDRILRSEADLAALLALYNRVWRNRKVPDAESDPLAGILLLSGIARSQAGFLAVRNRIYRRVFNPAWIRGNTPGAEIRRQRAAFRRGVLRAVAVAAPIIIVIIGLALTAVKQSRVANAQRSIAEARQRANRHLLYDAQMNLAQQEWESGHTGTVIDLLEAQRPQPEDEDLRGFEWYYLWRQCHTDLATLQHPAAVNSVAFSPDGKVLATGCDDNVVRLWDFGTRTVLGEMTGHTGPVKSVAFSPDGRFLATASGDKTVKLWDTASRTEIATLAGHQNVVEAVAFSPDGERIATGADDGAVMIWEVRPQAESEPRARHFAPPSNWVLAKPPRGQKRQRPSDLLGVLPRDGQLTGFYWTLVTTLGIQTGPVYSVAFSPDGTTLAIGSAKALKLWKLASRSWITLHEQTDDDTDAEVSSLSFSRNGRALAATRHDETTIWDLSTNTSRLGLPSPHGVATAVKFSPDQRAVATGAQDGMVELRDPTSGDEIIPCRGHTDAVRSMAFSSDGSILATASADKAVKLWDLGSPPAEVLALPGHSRLVGSIAFSPTDRLMATGGNDMTARIWDLTTGNQLAVINPHRNTVRAVAFSPDGRVLATGGNKLMLWCVPTGTEIAELWASRKGEEEEIYSVSFSPNDSFLAAGNLDRSVRLYDVTTGKEASTFRGHSGGVAALAFSSDSRVLGSAALTEVKLWDLDSKVELPSTRGFEDLANSIAQYPGSYYPPRLGLSVRDHDGWWYHAYLRTDVPRSEGWHKFEMGVDERGYTTLIDGVPVAQGSSVSGFTDIHLQVNAPSWRPDAAYYFDDLCITGLSGEVIYCDDFEEDRITDFWNVEQQYGRATLSTEQSHTGSQSLKMETRKGGHRSIQLSHHFATIQQGTMSVWLYDSAAGRETVYVYVYLYDHSRSRGYECTALSPNAKLLAVAGHDDRTVKILDPSAGHEIATLQSHAGPVRCLAFSPDGKRLASGSDDKSIKLWDVSTWREVATFKGSQSAVRLIKFSPDSRVMATDGVDNVLQVWRAWDAP